MEAIKLRQSIGFGNLGYYYCQCPGSGFCGINHEGEYYAKPEADAVIARMEHQIEVLNADLTRCQEAKSAIGDKCLRLEAEIARYKSNINTTEAATGMCGIYAKLEADVERIGMKLRAICPHKKFYEISFEDGYPGGDIATYECEYCGYHFTGELPQ